MGGLKLTQATKKSHFRSLALLLIALAIYSIENFSPVFIISSTIFIYICKPVMWLFVILTVLSFPETKPFGKIRLNILLRWMTILLAGIYIMIMLLGGLVAGFGKSPYDHSAFGIATNAVFIFTVLIGRELVRNHLINSSKGRNYVFTLCMFVLLMTLINIPVNAFDNLKTKLDIIKFLGQKVLPELSLNIFATYLVYIGGPVLSIMYIGIKQCYYWFFPILPNLNWIMQTLIETLCPFFSFMFLQYIYSSEAKISNSNHAETKNPLGWILTCVISISIVWFSVGVFPVRPFVVATGSMEPVIYPGDMVLVKRIEMKDLKAGDIIQFRRENIYIFHRITGIIIDKKVAKYQTKGDNNKIADPELVIPEDIRGKVIYTIPKIGWPTLFLKSGSSADREKAEF